MRRRRVKRQIEIPAKGPRRIQIITSNTCRQEKNSYTYLNGDLARYELEPIAQSSHADDDSQEQKRKNGNVMVRAEDIFQLAIRQQNVSQGRQSECADL